MENDDSGKTATSVIVQPLCSVSLSLTRDVYRCARSSEWGDQLPIVQKVEEDVQSDSE